MNDNTSNEIIQLVSFQIGQEEYGIDILKVQEINRIVEITKVPQAPSFSEGVINLRGKVIPVINLRKKFELDDKEWDKETRIVVCVVEGNIIGMVVDSVSEVLRIPQSAIEPTPDVVLSENSDYISSIVRLEESMLILLDLSQIVKDEKQINREADKIA